MYLNDNFCAFSYTSTREMPVGTLCMPTDQKRNTFLAEPPLIVLPIGGLQPRSQGFTLLGTRLGDRIPEEGRGGYRYFVLTQKNF